jgi:MFS family permease
MSEMNEGGHAPAGKIGVFASFAIPNFRLLLTGTTLTNAAQWIQQITLSWLVYDLTGSGAMLGVVSLLRALASLAMIPAAGILIDRFSRRKLLLIINGWLFAISFALGIMLIAGYSKIFPLLVFSFMGGMAQTVDMSLRQVLVFDMVTRPLAPNAVALVQTGWSLMRLLGPAMGGILILWVGPGGNFLIQAGAYALVAITIMQIKFPDRKSVLRRGAMLEGIREGIRYIRKEPIIKSFMMLGMALPLLIIPIFDVLPPIYAVRVFGDGSGKVLGFLMASVGIGGIAGGIFTASLGHLERRGILQLVALFLLSLSLAGFAFARTLSVALLLLGLAGFFEMIFLTTNQTLVQLSIPNSLRGRITSVVNLNLALMPLGGLIAGFGSDLLGGPARITVILAGAGAVIPFLLFLFSTTIRNYRLSRAIVPDLAATQSSPHSIEDDHV